MELKEKPTVTVISKKKQKIVPLQEKVIFFIIQILLYRK